MAGLCERDNEPPRSLKAISDNAGEMSPGSSTESYPAFARIGLRENLGKNLNQVTYPNRDSNPGHLVSRPDALTVTPQVWTPLEHYPNDTIPRSWIGRGGEDRVHRVWPPRSPDLTSVIFICGVHKRQGVCTHLPATLQDLRYRIIEAVKSYFQSLFLKLKKYCREHL
ncbi:hypothetical protein ANN_22457 [Periplaneta americana]|uniref:Uncharacterized protein n=1 Tax=Periplaneta americana TaxID=6978 RepID=A0ABQ8S963_PERAM|nr:hypothetical protein ANN_22457 [Periplaneta americana]